MKLADPDFRTPARIDLVLGAEVFMSILRDGWRTGPRGTPSPLKTCFGWVLFGKIGCDVVDVANHTVEQLVCIDMSERRRSYAAVLTAGKNKDLRCTGQRKKRKDDGQQAQILRRDIPEDCRIRRQGFDRTRISPGERRDGSKPRRRWETKGFGWQDVGARTPQNEL